MAPMNADQASLMNASVFDANRRGRDFVVGDLHGQLPMLDALLSAVDFDAGRDRLFSVGDLIDRGPHSAALLERFAHGDGYFAVRGNHEAMLMGSDVSWVHFQSWQRNGGVWALPLSLPARRALAATAGKLPLTITLELADGRRIGLVHAEVPPGQTWQEACAVTMSSEDLWDTESRSTAASLIWGRRRFMALEFLQDDPEDESLSEWRRELNATAAKPITGVDLVICGHSIVASRQPEILGNTLFIDTGAFEKAGRLTIVEPLTGLYWQCCKHAGEISVPAQPQKIPRAVESY